jgi:glucan-binding YG repeat protein
MKTSSIKTNSASKAMLTTAAILAVQAFPATLSGQTVTKETQVQTTKKNIASYTKQRFPDGKMTIVGIENGNPVYRNSKSELFTINAQTGDLIFIKPEEFSNFNGYIKLNSAGKAVVANGNTKQKQLFHIKMAAESIMDVNIIGVDKAGHAIQKNSKGEAFYLDPTTGDMKFVNDLNGIVH